MTGNLVAWIKKLLNKVGKDSFWNAALESIPADFFNFKSSELYSEPNLFV
jgi:hypothetical protein